MLVSSLCHPVGKVPFIFSFFKPFPLLFSHFLPCFCLSGVQNSRMGWAVALILCRLVPVWAFGIGKVGLFLGCCRSVYHDVDGDDGTVEKYRCYTLDGCAWIPPK